MYPALLQVLDRAVQIVGHGARGHSQGHNPLTDIPRMNLHRALELEHFGLSGKADAEAAVKKAADCK